MSPGVAILVGLLALAARVIYAGRAQRRHYAALRNRARLPREW